jgi:hypothetical protein
MSVATAFSCVSLRAGPPLDDRSSAMRTVTIGFLTLLLSACGAGAGEPDGLYLMTRMVYGGSLETTAYRFDDGTVVRNPIAPEQQKPQDVGSYTLDGANLTMRFGEDESSSEVESGDEGCFFWDMGNFCPVGEFDQDTLDGSFSGGASAGFGAVTSTVTVVFRPDGSYTLASLGSVSTSEGSAGGSGGESGRHELDRNLLTLTPDGGASRSLTTFPYDDGSEGAQPRRIFFGGGMLKRQD